MSHTLLLADDSLTIQRVVELTFADEDIRIVAVSDGNQAIVRVEEEPPDIVLADVGMPGKTGYEVCSYIKHHSRLAHIPVLLLTGAFEPIDQQRAAEAGCDGVLAKPFDPHVVVGRVKELLRRPRPVSRDSSSTSPAPLDRANSGDDRHRLSGLPGDFLDELDTAFAKMPGERVDTAALPAGEHDVAGSLDRFRARDAGAADDRWDLTGPGTPVGDLPLSSTSAPSSRPANEHISPSGPAPTHAASPVLPHPPADTPLAGSGPAVPALAVAFAALLAAEQNPAVPADMTAWAPALAISDRLVERVAERVLERLSDRVVRESVESLVSAVAERLVREEIERIKASVK